MSPTGAKAAAHCHTILCTPPPVPSHVSVACMRAQGREQRKAVTAARYSCSRRRGAKGRRRGQAERVSTSAAVNRWLRNHSRPHTSTMGASQLRWGRPCRRRRGRVARHKKRKVTEPKSSKVDPEAEMLPKSGQPWSKFGPKSATNCQSWLVNFGPHGHNLAQKALFLNN